MSLLGRGRVGTPGGLSKVKENREVMATPMAPAPSYKGTCPKQGTRALEGSWASHTYRCGCCHCCCLPSVVQVLVSFPSPLFPRPCPLGRCRGTPFLPEHRPLPRIILDLSSLLALKTGS